MNNLWRNLKDILWPSVLSVATSLLAVLVALVSPESQELVLALGLTSISMGLLAQRG